jgi:4-amino-4-deoxy-L-arabinose transferase-like glycosyltransferase
LLPVYPALLAATFKLFGVFTVRSAIAILAFNSLLSALTCIPIVLLARRSFGSRVATWAGWLWVFFPYGIYLSAGRIWDTQLLTLELACLLLFTYYLADGCGPGAWAGYGLLWGVAALTNPSVLVLLPVLGIWACHRRSRRGLPWLRPAAISALLFAAVITPWEVRNYRVFGQFIPLRDNFWMEMRVGNTGDLTNIDPDWAHPRTLAEFQQFQSLGEITYMRRERRLVLNFISSYPGMFAWVTLKHVIFTWTGFWSLDPAYTREEPFQIPNVIFCSVWTLLMLLGYRVARRLLPLAHLVPYLAVVVLYPALFYITHPTLEYRHVIDPVVVIFSACFLAALPRWLPVHRDRGMRSTTAKPATVNADR